jgi:uncharacterized protein
MKPHGPAKISRRQFLRIGGYGAAGVMAANSFWWEPDWIRIKTVRLTEGVPRHRLVHFTDLHFKGNITDLEKVVEKIDSLSPDFACFTGDLIEEAHYAGRALETLRTIKCPLYGVPGNHDHWSHADFDKFADAFAATGGGWLMDRQVTAAAGRITISGAAGDGREPPSFHRRRGTKNLLLMHFPAWADRLRGERFDLILAGHSHGGQVRLPLIGALILPYNVGKYDMGLFRTPGGPLYVNPGIGWLLVRARFLCRPELTVIEI